MKMNYWPFLAVAVSTSLLAQPATNTPAATGATPAEAVAPAATPTNAPAAKADKKKKKKAEKSAAKKKEAAPELKTVPLVAGPATVIASNVNVRGQAKLNSEVITRLQKGDSVAVLEEVKLKKSAPDEPSAWARIILPAKAHAWVSASYIDGTNKTVLKKLNLRGGPGENYSVLGTLKKGDEVKEVSRKDDWIQIEAPAEASAFVAAQYLRQEPAGSTPVEPLATNAITETPLVAIPPTEPPVTPAPTEPAATNITAASNPAPPVEEPPQPRIVQREGVVHGTLSIQAPTPYELVSPETHKPINYLHAPSPSLDLGRYKGIHIIVTGEEGLDERWPNTPVITIQKIQVLD